MTQISKMEEQDELDGLNENVKVQNETTDDNFEAVETEDVNSEIETVTQTALVTQHYDEFTRDIGKFQAMVDSKVLPKHIKTPEAAFAVIKMGHELGFDDMTSINNILLIEGRLTVTADAQAALMMNAGCYWEVIYDGDYMFSNGEILKTKPFGGKKKSDGSGWLVEPTLDKDNKPYHAYDRITRLRVHYQGRVSDVDYYWSDAKEHGLTDKSNWQKMPRQMMYARCVAKVRTQIVPQATKGLYSTDEIIDSLDKMPKNIKLNSETGTVISINE